MSSDILYINRPGGVLLHIEGKGTEHVGYGEPVPENITEGQAAVIGRFTSTRSPRGEADIRAEVTKQAQENAALTQVQPGSTSSPIPGNYSELDEAGAGRLVAAIRDPKEQAVVYLHEQAGAGRQSVLDSASPEAQEIAQDMVDQNRAAVPENVTVDGADPAEVRELRDQLAELREQLGEVQAAQQGEYVPVDPEDHEKPELIEMAEKLGVDLGSKDTKDEIAEKINGYNKALVDGPAPAESPEG